MNSRATLTLWITLLLAVMAAAGVALLVGDGHLQWPGSALDWQVIVQIRLPRVSAAILVGALLGLAGLLMQVLLRNPLADPYVLGVSGGAAAFALGATVLGLNWLPQGVPAMAGALLSVLLVFVVARGEGPWSTARMLLAGVVLASGWGALISLLLSLSDERSVKGMLYWLMGDLSYAQVHPAWLLTLPGVIALTALRARSLNVLSAGLTEAALLGEPTGRRRTEIYLAASTMTAAAVVVAGTVGFVGLIIPHLCRMLVGGDHRRLIPASALSGAAFLVVADTLARSLIAPRQLPVGVLTAIIGVPVFLLLLRRDRG